MVGVQLQHMRVDRLARFLNLPVGGEKRLLLVGEEFLESRKKNKKR